MELEKESFVPVEEKKRGRRGTRSSQDTLASALTAAGDRTLVNQLLWQGFVSHQRMKESSKAELQLGVKGDGSPGLLMASLGRDRAPRTLLWCGAGSSVHSRHCS